MKTLKREEIIEKLIDDAINLIVDGQRLCYLGSILSNGFCGYTKQTNKQLEQEYNERLKPEDEKIKVVK